MQFGSSDNGQHFVYTLLDGYNKILEQGSLDQSNAITTREFKYKEEYGDRLAIPLSQCQEFKDPQNIPVTFMDFMEYCNIQNSGAISTQGEIDFDKVE